MGKKEDASGKRKPMCSRPEAKQNNKKQTSKTDTFSHGKGHTVPNDCRIDFEEGSCKELSKTTYFESYPVDT